MRTSQFLLQTLKEKPSDAELISHQLMLRAGMIRKLTSGIYTWLPLGLRVLQKVSSIIREEMNRVGALEILMPSIQPAELWQETGRWETAGAELLKIKDRHQRNFCYGPTHEEVVTDLVRGEIHSYKQLPLTLYQIQTKFRDEIRPRFGVMRSREFLMKDAYSFHLDLNSLEQTYQVMHEAYTRIFSRLGFNFRAVDADTGMMGGSKSQEFHALANSGEDTIVYSDESNYAANIELALKRHLHLDPNQTTPEQLIGLPSPDSKGKLHIARGIEIGQIFQLGLKYSEAMKAVVLDAEGKSIPLLMGCYGIGVSRTVAAAIEQHHDERGICWSSQMSPFTIALVPIGFHKSAEIKKTALEVYEKLSKAGYEVLLDDRDERAGVLFSDMDLIGIPHRLVISERSLANQQIEYKARNKKDSQLLAIENIVNIDYTR